MDVPVPKTSLFLFTFLRVPLSTDTSVWSTKSWNCWPSNVSVLWFRKCCEGHYSKVRGWFGDITEEAETWWAVVVSSSWTVQTTCFLW